jgi:hypothetical protein
VIAIPGVLGRFNYLLPRFYGEDAGRTKGSAVLVGYMFLEVCVCVWQAIQFSVGKAGLGGGWGGCGGFYTPCAEAYGEERLS